MDIKTIRKSERGLTFSIPSHGAFAIGEHYDYAIDRMATVPTIRLSASSDGRYKMSRKKNGAKYDSLVDLRNKEVMSAVAEMSEICIRVRDEVIEVYDSKAKAGKRGILLSFPRVQLAQLRKAAGMDDIAAADCLLNGAQLTFDDYLSSRSCAVSIPTVQHDLADVYTLVSLFSGAGILDWPFAQDSRFKILYAIDYDEAACQTYRQNIGLHVVHGDVHRAFTEDGYPLDHMVDSPDIIIGGPSCKPFSNANRHTRLADHPDSDLVVQYMRIVKTLRPKVFAMENVPVVLTACDGAYYDAIKEVAQECGYELDARVIQDNEVGGYTTRRRAIILGSRIGPVQFGNVAIKSGSRTVADAFAKIDESWTNRDDLTVPSPDVRKRMSFVPQGGNYTSIPAEYQTGSKNRHSCTYRRLAFNAPSPTIVNWRKPPLVHPTEDRTLTVAEAKALQGLPGNFIVCGSLSEKQQQVGNSVPVALGEYIKNAVLRLLQAGANCKVAWSPA